MDPALSFTRHINGVIAKAGGIARRILRNFHTKCVHTLFAAFAAYSRPHLEFASIVWNSCPRKSSDRIESVQRMFTRRIFQRAGLKCMKYETRLSYLDAQSLTSRRESADAIFCHSVLKGLHHCPSLRAQTQAERSSSRLPSRAAIEKSPKGPRRTCGQYSANIQSYSCLYPVAQYWCF